MGERKDEWGVAPVFDWAGRHWIALTVLAWLAFGAWGIYERWSGITWFALGDTDDNLRIAQVRALLAGQDWFDLRQYRLNPPLGADVHWSRLVDLPLAGLILGLRPFLGGPDAERWAVAIAPLLPHLVALTGIALTVRRLVAPGAFVLAFAALVYAASANSMFMPLRIDHHGWQLAFLSLAIAGIADPRRARGGATLGIATALSLTIGLELLIYLALAAGATVLCWVFDRDLPGQAGERRRLAVYAATLSGGTALGFLLFASYANRQPVCDALSPVWLSDALVGGALLVVLAALSPAGWKQRLALAVAAGAILAAFHALAWPHCLSRLEGVSPEVQQLWLDNVREARPLYRHGWQTAVRTAALPITGLFGWAVLAWHVRREPERLRRTLGAALPALAATLLLLWQTRTGPAAQLLGAIGAAALVWICVPPLARARNWLLASLGLAIVVVVGLGGAVPFAMHYVAPKPQTARDKAIAKANRLCPSMFGMRPIAQQPRGRVFTFVDLGPRLIAVTHHDAVTGPYHRNGEQIADVMKAFRGDADQARAIIAKYRSDYLLDCPDSSTTTIFKASAPNGFYGRLDRGEVPNWLQPIELPADSPFRMWRVLP
jgi:hypothetical protein